MKSLRPIILILLILPCHKEEALAVNPQQFIIGKWEAIAVGNWPDMRPTEASGFTEFTSDNIVVFFDYSTNTYVNPSLYWVTDSLLIRAFYRDDGKQILFKQQYEFERNPFTGDQLRLDIVDAIPIYRTAIFRRT